jgi:DNA-binding LacI/PurR family transcriptional regulator
MEDLWKEPAGLIMNGPHDAVRLMQFAHQQNLPVGHHIGIASCDMTEDFRLASPGLSHVTNNRFVLGQQAGTMMLELLANRKSKCPTITTSGQWFAGNTAMGTK